MTYDGQPLTDETKYKNFDLKYIRNRWDNRADFWDEELKNSSSHLNRCGSYKKFLELLDVIIAKIPADKRKTLFDLGCGTGAIIQRYARFFEKSYGIDISAKMLEKAKEKNLPNVELLQEDVFHYLNRTRGASAIVSRGILPSHYGLENTLVLVSKIFFALATEGIVFFDLINKDSEKIPYGKTAYRAEEILNICKKAGFSEINIYAEKNYPLLYIEAKKI